MKRSKKIIWSILLLIVILVVATVSYLHFSTYQPSHQAQIASQVATETNEVTTFKAKHNKMTVIFYLALW